MTTLSSRLTLTQPQLMTLRARDALLQAGFTSWSTLAQPLIVCVGLYGEAKEVMDEITKYGPSGHAVVRAIIDLRLGGAFPSEEPQGKQWLYLAIPSPDRRAQTNRQLAQVCGVRFVVPA